MARKEDKLRPYRVDYFNIDEMKDVDLALVRSAAVRAVTAAEAAGKVLADNEALPIILIRSYRYYEQIPTACDYKAVEDLFTDKNALIVMEEVEKYRAAQTQTNDLGSTPAAQTQMDAVAEQADAAVSSRVFIVLREIIVEMIGVDEDEITPTTSFVDDLGADSLDQIELVMAVEEVFNIEIQDEEAEKLLTVGAAVDYISKRVGEVVLKLSAEEQAVQDYLQHDAMTNEGGHVTRYSDSSLYDEVCTQCGATDRDGKLEQPCSAAPVAADHATPDPAYGVARATFYKSGTGTVIQDGSSTPIQADTDANLRVAPTSGPESPATIAVVDDLKGMLSNDAHEQTMATFVPDSVPEGKHFTTESVPQVEFIPEAVIDGVAPLGVESAVVNPKVGNPFVAQPNEPSSVGLKVLAISVITILVLTGLIFILRPH